MVEFAWCHLLRVVGVTSQALSEITNSPKYNKEYVETSEGNLFLDIRVNRVHASLDSPN